MAGEAFFRRVFGPNETVTNFLDLRMYYRGLDETSRESRDRTKEFPASIGDLRNRWMWEFYLNLVRWEPIATRIPMEPDECADEIRLNWRAYREGDNSVLRPGKRGYGFLNTNDFEDLPHLR
jgi:hypothetical protein